MPRGSRNDPCVPGRQPLNFTKVPVPPPPRARRARRKETIDELIQGWTHGLDYIERRYLDDMGYGRWIARGRVTAEMLVELLLLTLEEYEDVAADPVADRATERWRMIEILQRRRAQGLTEEDAALLHDLEQLDTSNRPRRARTPCTVGRRRARVRTRRRGDRTGVGRDPQKTRSGTQERAPRDHRVRLLDREDDARRGERSHGVGARRASSASGTICVSSSTSSALAAFQMSSHRSICAAGCMSSRIGSGASGAFRSLSRPSRRRSRSPTCWSRIYSC